ncbi:MAG TPA: hypothetical protein VFA37_06585 [Gaiellaceae bacterium]|nr:hypothetical protein [Gaiellaceae bacterium]
MPFGRAAFVALCIPFLGMVAVFVAIGWSIGPWVPLGIVIATSLMFVAAHWWTRRGRRLLQTDPAEGRRVLEAQAERVGWAMGRMTVIWIAFSILFVVVLLAFRL